MEELTGLKKDWIFTNLIFYNNQTLTIDEFNEKKYLVRNEQI